eukprot:4755038-Pyramimonas_sp.AAC.1
MGSARVFVGDAAPEFLDQAARFSGWQRPPWRPRLPVARPPRGLEGPSLTTSPADSHRRDEPSARGSQAGRAFSSSLQGVSDSYRRDEPSAREPETMPMDAESAAETAAM